MAKVKGISQAVIDSFRGTICFITKKGQIIAQKWPRKSTHKRSPDELFNWQAMREAQTAVKTLKPSVRTAYKLLASGTDFMWQDLFNSAFLKEYYKNREAPCYVRDFSYTKFGPRIQIAYELSKESLVSVTRHNISKYGVVIPVGNKMCKPGCKGPPDPDPDATEWQCEFQGNTNFTSIPLSAKSKKIVAPENEEGCDWTWDWLKEHWPEAGWEYDPTAIAVAWYSAIGFFLPIYEGRIFGKMMALDIDLTEEKLGVKPEDVIKAWIECEGSMNSFYISGFKCIQTGDLVPLQAGKVAFGDLLPYIGRMGSIFDFRPIEMPDPPPKPTCPEEGYEYWSGGEAREGSFRCKYCYEQKVIIPYESGGALEIKVSHAEEIKTTWFRAWDSALVDWAHREWEEPYSQKWRNYGLGYRRVPGGYTAQIVTFRKPIIYRIGEIMSEEEFSNVKFGRIELPRQLNWPNQEPDGGVGTDIFPGWWEKQEHPITGVLVPAGVLTYPNTTLLLQSQPPDFHNLRPQDPTETGFTSKGYRDPENPNPKLVLYKKGDRTHIFTPPWNWNSPYWLKFSQQDQLEPVISPFFRIE